MTRGLSVFFVLAALIALPAAAAQGVRVVDEPGPAEVGPGGEAVLAWTIASVDDRGHFILASVDAAGDGWAVSIEPAAQNIPAGGTATFVATVQVGGRPAQESTTITVVFEEAATGNRSVHEATVHAVGFGRILGIWENPLDPPLSGAAGTFALNVLAWAVVGVLAMLVVGPVLHMATRRTKSTVDDEVIRILARPAFYLIFLYGLRVSLASLHLPVWLARAVHIVWLVATVVVVAMAVFRLWHEVIVAFGRRAASRSRSDLDDRLLPVLEKVGGIAIVVVAFFYVADGLGWNMTWLAAGGAIGGLVIAFAAQDTLGNFFSGIHLMVDRPFAVGDDIILESGELCTVRRIGLRSTHLYHVVNHELIIVPNNLLANHRIINVVRPDTLHKVKVEVGVAYGTDPKRVEQILLDIARQHPLTLTDSEHEPFVRFNAFGQSSLDFAVHTWIHDVYTRFRVASELREAIALRFAEEDIEIPFPQRVVWNGREEADRRASAT